MTDPRSTRARLADELYDHICAHFLQHQAYPSQRRLAADLGVPRHQISRRVAYLQGQGRIREGTTVPVQANWRALD